MKAYAAIGRVFAWAVLYLGGVYFVNLGRSWQIALGYALLVGSWEVIRTWASPWLKSDKEPK